MQSNAQENNMMHKTLDLTSSLEVRSGAASSAGEEGQRSCGMRSVLTIAFQFPFESSLQDNVAAMARQYVRSVISSVQRVAVAISPSGLAPPLGLKLSLGSPEALTLAHWICQSYKLVSLYLFLYSSIPVVWKLVKSSL